MNGNSKARQLDLGSICYTYPVTCTCCYAPIFELKSRAQDIISIHKMCNSFFQQDFGWRIFWDSVSQLVFLGKKKFLRPPERCKFGIIIIFTTSSKLVYILTHEWWNYGLTIFFITYNAMQVVGILNGELKDQKRKKLSIIFIYLSVS